ncbi:hypothetical protein LAZ67_4004027 [Cordylochernes scorpioides]|uniref:Mos1 transposase HTH domain-containing protein n=1 Tax=Cordylochernes scorpioides TaxID=51811 RepID=A0ABY6KEY1_9ARAC|nr:hypothetical protein LAZ67_4004027 [Cordylochernes scorpioides]
MEQRAVIKFNAKLGRSASETYILMKQVYGTLCLSKSNVFIWHKRFSDGRNTLEDDKHTGRPSSSKTPESIEKVREFVENNDGRVLKRLIARNRRIRAEYRDEDSWCLLHDNAPSHSSLTVRRFLAKNNVCVLNHPPSSKKRIDRNDGVSMNRIDSDLGISRKRVQNIVKRDLGLRSYHLYRGQTISEAAMKKRLDKAKKLLSLKSPTTPKTTVSFCLQEMSGAHEAQVPEICHGPESLLKARPRRCKHTHTDVNIHTQMYTDVAAVPPTPPLPAPWPAEPAPPAPQERESTPAMATRCDELQLLTIQLMKELNLWPQLDSLYPDLVEAVLYPEDRKGFLRRLSPGNKRAIIQVLDKLSEHTRDLHSLTLRDLSELRAALPPLYQSGIQPNDLKDAILFIDERESLMARLTPAMRGVLAKFLSAAIEPARGNHPDVSSDLASLRRRCLDS